MVSFAWTSLRRLGVTLWRGQRGQAMAEYASITTILILGGLVGGIGWPYFGMMMAALDRYLSSVYFVLNLALP